MRKPDEDSILYLCRQDIEQICAQVDSVAVIREVFSLHASRQTILPDEAYLGWTNAHQEDVRSLNMPAYVGGTFDIAGTKVINGNISNPTRGLPRASGMTLLFDPISARICTMMEGAYLSSLRTASVTALAVDLLKGDEIHCLGIIGAGILAQAHIELLLRQLPLLELIYVYDMNPQRVAELEQHLAPALAAHHVTWHSMPSAEAAIRDAQLIVPVTTTTTGYIPFAWLQAGAIVVNVSLDDVMPDVVWQAQSVIVDDWFLVSNDTRRLLGRMYRDGKIIGPDEAGEVSAGQRKITAQLGDLVRGTKIGRRSQQDIILVNPFGLAIEDVALAQRVYQKAQELGVGRRLPR
ncbi:MAG: ornithine cyclodeaminase family protein [Ktedonobacteraceae bacterium]